MSNLLKLLQAGPLNLKNRLVMPPMAPFRYHEPSKR